MGLLMFLMVLTFALDIAVLGGKCQNRNTRRFCRSARCSTACRDGRASLTVPNQLELRAYSMSDLKLIALDSEDLHVISAHLQDAVLKVGDLAYLPGERRFAALLNRFNWSTARLEEHANGPMTRHRSAIRFERVTAARTHALDLKSKDQVLSLLAIQFEQLRDDDPAGHITLVFSGGAAIQLSVECIEVELRDLGGAWATTSRPSHPEDN